MEWKVGNIDRHWAIIDRKLTHVAHCLSVSELLNHLFGFDCTCHCLSKKFKFTYVITEQVLQEISYCRQEPFYVTRNNADDSIIFKLRTRSRRSVGGRRLRHMSTSAQVFQAINNKIVAHTIIPMSPSRRGYHKYMTIC